MVNFNLYNIKIDSAFSLRWEKSTAYARPRNYDALSFRVKGNATYLHQKQEFIIQKNDILFIPAHYDYQITANNDEEVYVIHFFIENSNFDKIHKFTPLNPDIFSRLFLEMMEVWRVKGIGYQAKLTSLFYEIVEQIEIQEYKKDLSHNTKKLQEVLEYIHANFTEKIAIPDLAKMEGLSNSRYITLFSKEMGKTPSEYILSLRLDRACELLITSDMEISQVGIATGYDDPYFFSKIFKKHVGISPSEYRKRNKNN